MRCTSPRTVGFLADGKTISWSSKKYSKQYATFPLPCGKCIECRLEYSRSWAVRSVHESKIHEKNCFITLTYSDDKLPAVTYSPKIKSRGAFNPDAAELKRSQLPYDEFQRFMKKLRAKVYDNKLKEIFPHEKTEEGRRNRARKELDKDTKKSLTESLAISFFVTGEYGDQTKRPHWHALLFNYRPSDEEYKYTTDRGDRVFESAELTELWANGNVEYGELTFESAAYVARYAAKKLIHGNDDTHDFEPLSKKSQRNAIGKRFLEKYYKDIFSHGYVVLENGLKTGIPRYYEKWLKDKHPDFWLHYISNVKPKYSETARLASEKIELEERKQNESRNLLTHGPVISNNEVRKIISESKHKLLQNYLKGDI